jgi:hypothetical protein
MFNNENEYKHGRPSLALRLAFGSNGFSSFHWSFFMKPAYLAIEHLPIA